MAETEKIPCTPRDLSRFIEKERKRNVAYLTSNYNLSRDDAQDVYQDACMALYQNIQNGALTELTARLSTYFTQICVFQAMKWIRDNRPVDLQRLEDILTIGSDYTIAQQLAMMDMVRNMPDPCKTILWQFHYENKSMTEIAVLVNFNGADSVKAKKSQCLSKLKSTFANRINSLKNGEE